MYTYRNKKNGATFTTPCVCTGEDYEEVKASAPASKAKSGKKQESVADAQSADSGGEDYKDVKASASAPKAKSGKKQEAADDTESADSGGEDS